MEQENRYLVLLKYLGNHQRLLAWLDLLPEERLMCAIVGRAYADLIVSGPPVSGDDSVAVRQNLRISANAFFTARGVYAYSFEYICQHLNLSARAIRNALYQAKLLT